jgi:hypothetical protein
MKFPPPLDIFFWSYTININLFQEVENFICVTEDKVQRNIIKGYAQNIKKLESSYETNENGLMITILTISMVSWLQLEIGIFLLYSLGEISQASEVPLTIEFNKKALNKDSEEYQTLRNSVRKVLDIVVG